jgi:uncharacterized protein YoxC
MKIILFICLAILAYSVIFFIVMLIGRYNAKKMQNYIIRISDAELEKMKQLQKQLDVYQRTLNEIIEDEERKLLTIKKN